MNLMVYQNTWDMDQVFPGGSDSPQFYEKLAELEKKNARFAELVNEWNADNDRPDYHTFAEILKEHEALSKGLGEARTFMSGLASADTSDAKARTNLNRIANHYKQLSNTLVVLQKKIGDFSQNDFDELLKIEPFNEMAFALTEIREESQKLLSTKEEELLNHLSIDGFQGWGDM